MSTRGNEFLRRYIALAAIILLLPLASRAQWDARPPGRLAPLTSGPVAIPLVATLESLSVSALPDALPFSASRAHVSPALNVITAWTIRSNRTILRLSGNSGALAAFDCDPLSVSAPDKAGRLPLRATPAMSENETDWPGIAQPIDSSGLPGSRRDNVDFVIDQSNMARSASPSSAIFILAQAL
jgi:hypothetical protein